VPHSPDYLASATVLGPSWRIDVPEMSKVLGYWRQGDYHADATQPDGYAAGYNVTRQNGTPHCADHRTSASVLLPNWKIDVVEASKLPGYWRQAAITLTIRRRTVTRPDHRSAWGLQKRMTADGLREGIRST
jgi:hypothetical protein